MALLTGGWTPSNMESHGFKCDFQAGCPLRIPKSIYSPQPMYHERVYLFVDVPAAYPFVSSMKYHDQTLFLPPASHTPCSLDKAVGITGGNMTM